MMRILAIDLGIKKVGLAISGPLRIPQPLKSVSRKDIFESLKEITKDYQVKCVVIGLPLTSKGKVGKMAKEARNFANIIEERFGIETELMDERFTTEEAIRLMSHGGFKGNRDSLSALLILKRYLEEYH